MDSKYGNPKKKPWALIPLLGLGYGGSKDSMCEVERETMVVVMAVESEYSYMGKREGRERVRERR